jgi:hypothetical protein
MFSNYKKYKNIGIFKFLYIYIYINLVNFYFSFGRFVSENENIKR